MLERLFSRARIILLILLPIIILLVVGGARILAPQTPALVMIYPDSLQAQQSSAPPRFLHGKVASLGWIAGRDCQRGMQAYLHTANTNPDAALVRTRWVDPTNGQLNNCQRDNCLPGRLIIATVVQ